jgi:small subunit ribosomal protein S8
MGREDEEETEVRGAGVHPVQALRPLAGLPAQVPAVPHLFQESGSGRRASGRHQGQLVTGRSEVAGGKEMSMTDPIADLLTRIRNAQQARHKTVDVPSSKMKVAIVAILADEGFVDNFKVLEEGVQGTIRVSLRYGIGGERAIQGVERVSRPGRRVYCGKDEIPKVLDGLGLTILSTPKGVLTGNACRRLGVGGEVLCNVW